MSFSLVLNDPIRAVARNEIKRRQQYSRGSSGNSRGGGVVDEVLGIRGGVVDEILGIIRGGGVVDEVLGIRGGGVVDEVLGIRRGCSR